MLNCIALYLEESGTSQKAFADLLDVSQPTVSDWVRGVKKPEGENVTKVARAIGKRPVDVLAEFHLGH